MTMNALSLYVTTTRMIFQANIEDSGAWSDINRLLSYLRQSLTCCVCGQLLHTPMSSTVSSCQHHVCKSCVGGKMRLKPSCSWCKDHSKFIENIQLRILLQCYKQLSCFVLSSPIALRWASLPCETNQGSSYSAGPNNSVISGPTTFEQLLEEGANLQDKFNFSDPSPLRGFNRHLNGHQSGATPFSNQNVKSNSNQLKPNQLENVKSGSPQSGTNQPSTLTVKSESVSSISSKPESMSSIFSNMTKTSGASLVSNIKSDISSSNQIQANAPSVNRKVRRGCRCGLATPNPGKLTCCGQRCPCYVENKPCQQCKCRGCRNPNRVSNLTTINIISSNSSNSSLISIPSSSLLQIPILAGDEEESQEMMTKGLSVITANVATGTEEICEKDNICSTDVATETDPELI